MRLLLKIGLAAVMAVFPAQGQTAPRKVVSLNLCSDELVLALADPGQITSLSHLSRNPRENPYWRQARAYPANDGSLLSVVGQRPALVFSMGGGGRDTERLARRIGARLVMLPYMMTLKDLKDSVRIVGTALGHPDRSERVIQRIAALEASAPATAVDAVYLGGKGVSLPATGLGADWMRLAGLRQRALQGDRMTLEQLLVRPPAILLRSDYRGDQYSSDQSWLSHPLAKRARKSRSIATDGRRWTCMGPSLIPEIVRIREGMKG